jgi:predicted permease
MSLQSELRYAGRTLRKTPAFTITAVAALALGIGANTAIFSLVNQVLLNPPGVSNPDRVVVVRCKYDKLALKSISVSATDYADVRGAKNVFEQAAMADEGDLNLTTEQGPVRLQGAMVTAHWFEVFGASPRLGRLFHEEDDQPGANNVVILSDAAWKRYFGANPAILDKTVDLNQKTYRVVGVMGSEFRWPRQVDAWIPIGLAADQYSEQNRFNESYFAAGRMRQGVTLPTANAYINVLSDRLRNQHTRAADYAKDSGWGMFAVPLTDFIAGDTKRPILILLAAVGFVLLIACSNIAGLMLARASARAREVAVRIALGASRIRLLQQTMMESIILATTGAVAGLAVAYLGMRGLLQLAPEQALSLVSISIDSTVLLFTFAVTIVSTVFFGLAPAWQISQIAPYETLKAAGRGGGASMARQRLRAVLVIGETALALMLLVGAGLFLRSLAHLQGVSPGFESNGVLVGTVSLPPARYSDNEKRIAFYRAVVERLAASPGVVTAAAGLPLPFSGNNASASFSIQDKPEGPGDPGPHGDIRYVAPGYFEALRIPLRSGRYFNTHDRLGSEPVAIIDDTLARQYWPNENPVGKHLRNGQRAPWATIVGVVGHVNHSDLSSDSNKGTYYYSMYQRAAPAAMFLVKTEGDAALLAGAMTQAVAAVDPNQPVHHIKTMADMVAASLAPRRFIMTLLTFFAGVALFMAAVGLYGVMSYSVTQRTQEIGIRMALGAERRSVLSLIVGQGLRLAAIGAGLGLIASIACARLIQTQLSGISAFDPVTLITTVVVLIGSALLAAWLPAYRATRVDPLEALRYE